MFFFYNCLFRAGWDISSLPCFCLHRDMHLLCDTLPSSLLFVRHDMCHQSDRLCSIWPFFDCDMIDLNDKVFYCLPCAVLCIDCLHPTWTFLSVSYLLGGVLWTVHHSSFFLDFLKHVVCFFFLAVFHVIVQTWLNSLSIASSERLVCLHSDFWPLIYCLSVLNVAAVQSFLFCFLFCCALLFFHCCFFPIFCRHSYDNAERSPYGTCIYETYKKLHICRHIC